MCLFQIGSGNTYQILNKQYITKITTPLVIICFKYFLKIAVRLCVILQKESLTVTLKSTFGDKVNSSSVCYLCHAKTIHLLFWGNKLKSYTLQQ